MAEISLTLMASTLNEEDAIRSLIETFQNEYRHRVNLRILIWDNAWQELVKYSLYGESPDVSEVGTTWIGSLAGMNTLRPFTPVEIRSLGGADSYLAASWQSGILESESHVWAIPWLSYASLLYFNNNMLRLGGIDDPRIAFKNFENFVLNLEKLQQNGIKHPLAMWTRQTRIVVHDAASFIWKEGGDFLTRDSKRVLFNQENSLKGLQNYFSLGRYINAEIDNSPDDQFITGNAAVVISGPQLWQSQLRDSQESVQGWNIAPVPGIPYLGGSSLVVWKNTKQIMAVLDLIKFLVNFRYIIPDSEHKNYFPSRVKFLADQAKMSEFHQMAIQAMMVGKSFPTSRLWGLVEENLFNLLTKTWTEVLKNNEQDSKSIILQNVEPVARRMNLALQG